LIRASISLTLLKWSIHNHALYSSLPFVNSIWLSSQVWFSYQRRHPWTIDLVFDWWLPFYVFSTQFQPARILKGGPIYILAVGCNPNHETRYPNCFSCHSKPICD
jgi:hypothetical protein